MTVYKERFTLVKEEEPEASRVPVSNNILLETGMTEEFTMGLKELPQESRLPTLKELPQESRVPEKIPKKMKLKTSECIK